ncbi:MAG: hypothetical protein HY237_02980 [Acidobacteria bacterium]|nr:hypothetical protein [Acidobacteriota bacterium]
MVEPGEYTVKISVDGKEATRTVKVEEDPRITMPAADRAARREAIMKLYELAKTADQGQKTITGLKTSLTAAMESWKKPGAPKIPENIQKAAEALAKQIEQLHGKFVAPERPLGDAGPPLTYMPPPFGQRVGRLMFAIEGYSAAPTSQQAAELATVSKLLGETSAQLKKLVDEDLANLNKMMNEAGIPHISVAPAEAARGRGRR